MSFAIAQFKEGKEFLMKKTILNKNWKFHLGDAENAFETEHNADGWQTVTLPHDWSVCYPKNRSCPSGTGYVIGGTAWYRKSFTLQEEDAGHPFFLCFDGVYKNSQVWINGYYLGRRPNGYISFRYDISDYLYFDGRSNVIAVKVTHEDTADSRWFTGSGITRKVTLEQYDFAYPAEYDIFFHLDSADKTSAAFTCECELALAKNSHKATISSPQSPKDAAIHAEVTVQAILFDADGTPVADAQTNAILLRDTMTTVRLSGNIDHPALWSPDFPHLYTLRITVSDLDGNSTIVGEEKVGIRTFSFDPDHGFFLNGIPTTFQGVCVHHDGGALGAAMSKGVWKRRLTKLKQMGCNAIRMSHNPHMPELYELCDEMGFLVIDEAFDEWEGCKNKWFRGHNVYPPKHQGYAEDFPEWHERDLTSLIRRDRNHPSVVLWSIGNEIDYPNDPYNHPSFAEMTGNNDANKPEEERKYHSGRPNMERLSAVARELAAIVKRSDPTRPVTAAVAFPELSTTLGYIDPLDVVGYNYKEQFYAKDHARFPKKPLLGSENGHSYAAWRAVTEQEYISGQFLWTGVDFLGECGGWPFHSSGAGVLTTAGFEKPRYYLRQSWWQKEPVIYLCTGRNHPHGNREWKHVTESWNYLPGENVEVRCYTNAGQPKLYINGKEISEECRLGCTELGFYAWNVPFEEGVLEAVAGSARYALKTVGAAAKISLDNVGYDWDDIVQIELNVVDTTGQRVVNDQSRIRIHIEGECEYLGMDNGDIEDTNDYRDFRRNTLDGRLMIYLRKKGDAPVTVHAVSGYLGMAQITV